MDIWLTILLIVAVVAPIVWLARRKDQRRERAEFEAPEDIFDAPVARGTAGSGGRAGRGSDHDRHEGDANDAGGGDGGGGGGD